MVPSLFSIFLDYLCNFECSHCSVGSSPRTSMPMPRELLVKALADIGEIPSAKVVVFTGGEPSLRKALLLEGIALGKKAKCITRVVTNGWWATTPERAAKFVDELKEAGLDELNTSYDDYHKPFAPLTNIVNLVVAGIASRMRVAVGTIYDSSSVYHSYRIRDEIAGAMGVSVDSLEQKVFFIDDHPTPTGAAELLQIGDLDGGEKLNLGCTEVLKTVSIHPDGTVKVCCGHAMFYQPDLSIGNLFEETLTDMASRARQNLVYWWIHMLGPKRILDKLGVKGTYSSICHACHVLLGEHREQMLQYLAAHKGEVFVRDVLCSDHLGRAAMVVTKRRDEIMNRLRVIN